MTPYAEWNRTWGEVGITHNLGEHGEDCDDGFSFRLTLSTGIDAFNLGIAFRRPGAAGGCGALGIGFLLFLVKLEWWPR